ncbi:MAG: phosphotransferase [Desulfurivibrio sp.]|nr:phosphotransferase [Desulfurivibrio sp.]
MSTGEQLIAEIQRLWPCLGDPGEAPVAVEKLAPDGSQRRFYRCRLASGVSRLLVLPSRAEGVELAEARAAATIGRHLYRAGVPVPRIYGFDPASGGLLLEDLGDLSLHQYLQSDPAPPAIFNFYQEAIEALLKLQISARPGFPVDACWDTTRYDRALMLQRESGYFYQALGRDGLGWPPMSAELAAEFALLADWAAAQPADFVLHRDYQCRNLLLTDEQVRLIDFQGARLGPLAYDLAALLNDPYAALAPALRQELWGYYCHRAAELLPGFEQDNFRRGWYPLALQRNLQILGAFAFLSRQRGKPFFAAYLLPAARQLAALLAEMPAGHHLPRLRRLAAGLPEQLENW